jgi:hypothetical protein
LVYTALFGGFYLVLAAPQLGSTKDPSRRPRHRYNTRSISRPLYIWGVLRKIINFYFMKNQLKK